MSSRAPLKLLLLVMLVCFVLGLLSVFLRQTQQDAGPTPTATLQSADGQTTILVLGVDAFAGADTRLDSIWLATYRLPGKGVFLYGIPVNEQVGSGASADLRTLFHWSAEAGVDPAFMAGLQKIAPLVPQAVVLMDQTAFAALVDYLGGVELNGSSFGGNQVLGVLSLVGDDPQAMLSTQAHLLGALVTKLPALSETPDLSPVQSLIPEHMHLSLPLSQLFGLISPLLPVEPGSVYVNLWSKPTAP